MKYGLLTILFFCVTVALIITSSYIQHFELGNNTVDQRSIFMDKVNFFTVAFALIMIFVTIGSLIVWGIILDD